MSNKTTTNQELSKNEYLIALINDLNDQGILSQKWEERTKVKQNFKQYENILQKVESEQESILNLITKNDNCIASIRGTFGRLKKGTNYIKEEDYRNFLKDKLHNALIELSKQQIGASKRLGYGVLDWHIELNGESMFSTICDKEYIFNKKIEMSKKCSDYIHTYEEWADRHYESLDIAKF